MSKSTGTLPQAVSVVESAAIQDSKGGPDRIVALTTPAPAPTAPDPFNPAELRLSQDFTVTSGVKKLLTTVPVRKPSREWWIQTHPGDEYRLTTCVLELKEDSETYLVAKPLWEHLATEGTFGPRLLTLASNRQGVNFIWPIRLPGSDGRLDEWNRSALEAARNFGGQWIRVASNRSLGAYEVSTTNSISVEPQWPTLPFNEILRVAFKDKFIDSTDHPVLKRLRGEL